MKRIIGKIRAIHIVVLLLILILMKLNTIAKDLSYFDPYIDLSVIEDRLDNIQYSLNDIRDSLYDR